MKKITLFLAIALLIMIGTMANAAANTGDKTSKIDTLKSEAQQINESRQEKLGRLAGNVVNKLTKTLNNIDQLMARVKDRLTKMDAAGRDVSAAQTKVPAAETAIASAKTTVQNLLTSLPSVITASTTTKTVRETNKATVKKAAEEVRRAHQAVVEVIRAIKPGKMKPVTATSTATSTQ